MRAVAEWAAGGPSEPAMLRSPSSCVPKAGCCSRRAPEEREGGAGPGRAGGLEQGTMNNSRGAEKQGTMRVRVCVCDTGIGHINVLGPNPLTLPAVQSEENLAADGIPGRLRLASAMPVCLAAVRRPDAATKVP